MTGDASEDVNTYIRSKLNDLAKKHGVKIIHAVESGSRAWGFPSKDSDYDVRFFYVHSLEHYLSVDRKSDVIETPIANDEFLTVDLDMNGWDIKKAIYLALRGNAVVNEWLTSPIKYFYNEGYYDDLYSFVRGIADLGAYYHFYLNYMRQPWNSYAKIKSENIKIKHYCYVLRCALSLEWLREQKTPPPMDVPSLIHGIDLCDSLLSEIDFLITSKLISTESDTMPRNTILDEFINNSTDLDRTRSEKIELEKRNIDVANEFFRKILLNDNSIALNPSAKN